MTFCVVEFSYFGLCKVPGREGLRSSAVYLGISQGEDKPGARDKILNTKVARRAEEGRRRPEGEQATVQGPAACEEVVLNRSAASLRS